MKKSSDLVKSSGVDVVALTSTRRDALGLVEFLSEAPCETPAEEAWFSTQLSNVRALQKGLEERRTAITKPLLEAKRAIDALFSPATKPLAECEGIIRRKLAEAGNRRLAAQRASLLAAETAAVEGRVEDAIEALAAAPVAVKTEGSTSKVVRAWRVVDLASVPREFLQLDTDALDLAAKKGVESIPGIEFYDEVKVRAK